ncbi:hypothetical protein SAMN06265795_101111 [Noviherbaspirillum humi]|uniref:Uncharacterized protein n=1 Tax=Noviherbaspirillum humi TaxID=1688639 RepID=A0A239BWF7_9BURK|nr:hypothetical protein [Noviherbaspirillum humi]SNS11982.1 hypothetical protein SAMN06265795_101111 [Noviherbaspirillum humi]
MKITVMSASEAAYLLRKELGPVRSWLDTLSDMRRGKVAVSGFILLPECKGKGDRAWLPMYQAAKVWEFIEAVRAADPSTKRNEPPLMKTALSDSTDIRHWRLRKLPTARTAFVVSCAASPSAYVAAA